MLDEVLNDDGHTALMLCCYRNDHEGARVLIDANAALDSLDNYGQTALMCACALGRHECAQALIDANAAVDMVHNYENTALMMACISGRHECAQALINAHADLELTYRGGKNALMIACESPPPPHFSQSQRHGRIRCALAILAATAPIEVADFPDQAASLKFACDRLQRIETVLSSTHVIVDAPPLARVRDLKTDAQGIIVSFAACSQLHSYFSLVGLASSLPSAQ